MFEGWLFRILGCEPFTHQQELFITIASFTTFIGGYLVCLVVEMKTRLRANRVTAEPTIDEATRYELETIIEVQTETIAMAKKGIQALHDSCTECPWRKTGVKGLRVIETSDMPIDCGNR